MGGIFIRGFVGALFMAAIASAAPVQQKMPAINRDRLPEALRNAPLERLSSGALMLLNQEDLVQPPAAWFAHQSKTSQADQVAALVALDPRVGANIRLGDDPSALPSNQRAQAEPHIARSLLDPDFLVAVFQEGRFASGGGSVDCGYSISTNGGQTWTRALIPNLTTTSGGAYARATDPVAGVDLAGNVYLNTLVTTPPDFDNGVSKVMISKSTDGGATFAAPVIAYQPSNTSIFPDKNWMTINNFSGTPTAGRIYVTFTLFGSASPIVRTYSDNGGANWSAPAYVHSSATNAQGSQPVFRPNGNLVIVYWNFDSNSLQAVISTDGGANFGTPKFITSVTRYDEPSIRTGSFLPSATADRTNGNIYVVYQALISGNPRIAFTKSTDGGTTWAAPKVISDNPAGSGVFNPAINTSPDGQTLTAVFYDHRNNPGSNVLVDLYLAQSFDGGATWQPNIRLTSTSTNATLAPLTSEGYMLGDYMGVAETTNVNVPAVPVWVDTRTGNPDPFITRIGIAPQLDFTSWEAARLSLHQINDPALGGQAGDADMDGEDNSSEFQSMADPNDANSVVRTAAQLNISTRLNVLTGDDVGIAGFIINGAAQKKVLLRVRGPSLSAEGVPNVMQDPVLELHYPNGDVVVDNDWQDSASQKMAIEATGLPPTNDKEAALVETLSPGAYTAIVKGNGDTNNTGVALVEVYDVDPGSSSTLNNLSTRGFADIGDNVMIGGEIVGRGLGVNGAGSVHVLLRARGPSLASGGVPNPLQDPVLELHDGNGGLIDSNDDWKENQSEIEGTGLQPSDDRESAILAVLTKGNYTAVLTGKNGTTGTAIIEAFKVQ